MQQNPVAFSLLLTCGLPLLIFFAGFWLGRGGPLPGGRRIVVGIKRDSYDDD